MNTKLLPLATLLLAACTGTQTPNEALYEEGVSKALAQHRKATVHQLAYHLGFDIPADASEPILGYDTLRFTLDSAQEVILDFREEPERIQQVTINGKPAECQIAREHIILPAKALQAGNNEVAIRFTAGDQSLNRNADYLYTLFVPDRARTAFPCMDQPNLKAQFTLTLQVPADWKAVSNGRCLTTQVTDGMQTIRFAQTEPLSTYLFAFAAGRFEHQEYTEEGRTIGAYYRETDPKRLAQLPEIFRQVMYSLHWLEDYTGMPYPFAKYDLVILPGFQFGGMEHTGATFYNDNTLFLSEKPTMDEQLSRSQLIAHETSHMWFGDCVTMEWFNDVWTKEVFANYFAAAITAPLFPEVNHDLNWMKTYTASALSEDRTWGGTPIRQELDNMRNAGLIYNSIIYNKAPVMMRKLVELMGEEAFRKGIQQYLQQFKYNNATWEDLITLLDAETPQDLAAFSQVWVNLKGMPQLDVQLTDEMLTVTQIDPYGRNVCWPQTFGITLHTAQGDTTLTVQMTATDKTTNVPVPAGMQQAQLWPNTDGRAYGLLTLAENQLEGLLNSWTQVKGSTARFALLTALHENYLACRINDSRWMDFLLTTFPQEQDALTASTLIGYLREPASALPETDKAKLDQTLWKLSGSHPLYSARVQLLRQLFSLATQREVVDHLYSLWEQQSHPLLNINDYNSLSYELAIRLPSQSKQILAIQEKRNDNPDRLRQFQFISRAAVADTLVLDSLFQQLLTDPQARRIEPWTASVLSLLNHPLRQQHSVRYILPALEALEQVQRTGDIFFPGRWCSAVLGSHRSAQAYQQVQLFLQQHPDYPQLRLNKILLGSYGLYRKNGNNLFGK